MRTEFARRVSFIACGLILLLVVSTSAVGAAGEVASSGARESKSSVRDLSLKIDAALMQDLQQGKTSRALIVFNEQADLSGADALRTKKEKGEFVFNALREVAERTQGAVRADLEQRGVAYRSFYIANVIAVETLDMGVAMRLAQESSVGRIAADPEVRLDAPTVDANSASAASGIAWGIEKIRATKLWAEGIRGKGIVVAHQDTGVEWEHPALKKRYRGYHRKSGTVDHPYNWWDAIHSSDTGGSNDCGYSIAAPCDDFGHGTLTMGTLVGRDGENEIGVAPKAKWISCRNMDNGVGSPTTYMECFEFFLAPWDSSGNNPDPNRAPDVVSNSWGCTLDPPPDGEGCTEDSLKQATRALRAAGIFVTAAAGNGGSGCFSITDPAAIFNAATTIGATDSADHLASFSSRGPVPVDGRERLKPDISAPGVSVRTSGTGGGYTTASGTSLAAPHAAGAVALLWQGRPQLRGYIGETEKVLFESSNPKVAVPGKPTCGGTDEADIPNNFFGYGRLDVWKAYKQAR